MTLSDPSDPTPSPVAPGTILGHRYLLERPIASGGMAQVWLARDTDLEREVAVKVLHPHLQTSQDFLRRFRREAIAAARLSHPSIVAIYSTHSEPGLEAIVMEFIAGRTLRAVLDERGPIAFDYAVEVGVKVARALEIAHQAGIIHRDIKPANIMVTDRGQIKVTDFGIAKAATDGDLTTTGNLLGTAKYLAPEQLEGRNADPRSDIYALGVLLYEALAGVPPFSANTEAATALARLHQTPPALGNYRPDIPAALEQVVSRSMARNPDDRFARADILAEALLRADLSGPPAPPLGAHLPPGGSPGPVSQSNPVIQLPPNDSSTGTHQLTAVEPGAPSGSFPRLPPPPGGPAPGPSVVGGPSGPRGGSAMDGTAPLGPLTPERPRRSPLARTISLLVLVVALAGLFLVGRQLLAQQSVGQDQAQGDDQPTRDGVPPVIVGATSFDPQTSDANKTEREDLTSGAIDGDESTEWRSERYSRANFGGGLKDGVGLIIKLDAVSTVSKVELLTRSNGWDAAIYVGDDFDGDDPTAWGRPAAVLSGQDGEVEVQLEGANGNKVLLWITDTGTAKDDGQHRFELAEIKLA